jgi:hypothetical protein
MPKEPILDIGLIKRACSDGEANAIVDLSQTLCTNLAQRNIQVSKGRTQVVGRGEFLSDSLINNFAYRMLKACQRTKQVPPLELVELFQISLNQDRRPAKSDRRYMQWLEAVAFMKENPEAGVREIARTVDVNPSTVSRWKQTGKL